MVVGGWQVDRVVVESCSLRWVFQAPAGRRRDAGGAADEPWKDLHKGILHEATLKSERGVIWEVLWSQHYNTVRRLQNNHLLSLVKPRRMPEFGHGGWWTRHL